MKGPLTLPLKNCILNPLNTSQKMEQSDKQFMYDDGSYENFIFEAKKLEKELTEYDQQLDQQIETLNILHQNFSTLENEMNLIIGQLHEFK